MEFQDWMFDRRVLKRNFRKGIITRDDYLKYLKGLEDVANNIAEEEEEDDELEGKPAEGEETAEAAPEEVEA